MPRSLRFAIITGVVGASLVLGRASFAVERSRQARNGLTCINSTSGKTGSTRCSGNRGVKWRLRVRCSLQPDYTGPWNHGPGSDSFKCNFGVQNASVVFD
jgi:hypothetical protein